MDASCGLMESRSVLTCDRPLNWLDEREGGVLWFRSFFSANPDTWPRLLWKTSMRKGDSEEFPSSLPSTTTSPWTKVTGGRDEATLSLVFYFLSAKKGVCPRVSAQGCLPKGVCPGASAQGRLLILSFPPVLWKNQTTCQEYLGRVLANTPSILLKFCLTPPHVQHSGAKARTYSTLLVPLHSRRHILQWQRQALPLLHGPTPCLIPKGQIPVRPQIPTPVGASFLRTTLTRLVRS